MTVPPNASPRQRKSWMDEIRQELDRAMERERHLRAAMREDRLRQLDEHVTKTVSADRAGPRRAL